MKTRFTGSLLLISLLLLSACGQKGPLYRERGPAPAAAQATQSPLTDAAVTADSPNTDNSDTAVKPDAGSDDSSDSSAPLGTTY